MAVRAKKLLVEGGTDKRVIPYLIEANGVDWEADGTPIVHIDDLGGVDELLKPGLLEAELRASGLEALGAIVDANGDAKARWNQVRARCSSEFPELPALIPAGGLLEAHPDGQRFGVWIMPDNRFSGMLEDFLAALIPEESRPLHELAKESVSRAAECDAPFQSVHRTKAEIHTWLAWQDEPGKQLHQAVHHRVLDPNMPESQSFVAWFRDLYGV